MWNDGVYLGVKGKTGEIIVGTTEGIWKARSIQRKPTGQRWLSSSADMVRHVPWWSSENDPNIDGEAECYQVIPGGGDGAEGSGASSGSETRVHYEG